MRTSWTSRPSCDARPIEAAAASGDVIRRAVRLAGAIQEARSVPAMVVISPAERRLRRSFGRFFFGGMAVEIRQFDVTISKKP